MAPKKNETKSNETSAPAFTLNDSHRALLSEIDAGVKSGTLRHVSKAEAADLVAHGYIAVNPNMLDNSGNAASKLTDKGTKELASMPENENNTAAGNTTGTTAPAAGTPAVTFAIATVAPPKVERKAPTNSGAGRTPKYPLHQLEPGQAIFIPAAPDADVKSLSKSFGSMVSSRNKAAIKEHADNPETVADKHYTSRGIKDGAEAGFGDQYKGVKGTAIYCVPGSERPDRKPRKTKGEAAPAATEQAPAAAAE